jgi:hypothetical protein
MIERVLERGLQAELIGHLGYAKHEPAGGGNARNGTTPKTVATGSGTCRWRCRGTGRGRSSRGWCPRSASCQRLDDDHLPVCGRDDGPGHPRLLLGDPLLLHGIRSPWAAISWSC